MCIAIRALSVEVAAAMGANGSWALFAAASLIAASAVAASAPPAAEAVARAPAPPRAGTTPGGVAPSSNKGSILYTGAAGAVRARALQQHRVAPLDSHG